MNDINVEIKEDTINVELSDAGIVVPTNHNQLGGLDFASSGHTGFASKEYTDTEVAGVKSIIEGRGRFYALTLSDFIQLVTYGSVLIEPSGEYLELENMHTNDTISIIENYIPDVWLVKNYDDGVKEHYISWYYLPDSPEGIYKPVPPETEGAEKHTFRVDIFDQSIRLGYFLMTESDYSVIGGYAISASESAFRAETAESSAMGYSADAASYAGDAFQSKTDIEEMIGDKKWQVITRSEYNALPAKDANTFYLVTEG